MEDINSAYPVEMKELTKLTKLRKELIGKTATAKAFIGYGEIVNTWLDGDDVIVVIKPTNADPFTTFLSDCTIHRKSSPKPYRVTLQRLVAAGIILPGQALMISGVLVGAKVLIDNHPGEKIVVKTIMECWSEKNAIYMEVSFE